MTYCYKILEGVYVTTGIPPPTWIERWPVTPEQEAAIIGGANLSDATDDLLIESAGSIEVVEPPPPEPEPEPEP